jgi:polyphosphate kinase
VRPYVLAVKADRILVLFEGRDGAGKTTLATAIAHRWELEPTRSIARARVVKPSKPTEAELRGAYFERFVKLVPNRGELVLLDRSWYSRAGVERVMGFCTRRELERFFDEVGAFEERLLDSGIVFVKLYLTVTRDEQAKRLADRTAPTVIDRGAIARAADYDRAETEMLARTSTVRAPWRVVSTNGAPAEAALESWSIVQTALGDREGESQWIERHCSTDFESSMSEEASSASLS